MDAKRQKTQQLRLSFFAEGKGETRKTAERVEASKARNGTESSAGTERLMEEVVERGNLLDALKRVKRNRGSPGIDGMTVHELDAHLEIYWPDIRKQLMEGTYRPQPVRRVEIPKPNGGGVRKLGIPSVLDRLVQQMLLQVLQKRLDPTFSEHSYGFRPGRSAHQAIAKSQGYIKEGRQWVVDMDLEKFFDRVNHDRLMDLLSKRVEDKQVLKLVRAFLNAGVLEDGLVSPTKEGTPQGGPLSPLLSNIVLDELDRELERRGHVFVRYADDCNIYVRSERAGRRVMKGVTRFLEHKLKLKVNRHKSAVDTANRRKFLGFSFQVSGDFKRLIAPQAITRFKAEVRRLTRKKGGASIERTIQRVNVYLRGWIGYFGLCETPSVLRRLDAWIRRRLRCIIWRQWKTAKNRYKELRRRDVNRDLAERTAKSSKGPWHLSCSMATNVALSIGHFDDLGLLRLGPRTPA